MTPISAVWADQQPAPSFRPWTLVTVAG